MAVKKGIVFEIAGRLAELRKDKGWTQEYVANNLYITPSAYAKIERAEVDISIERLEDLANIYETTLAELLGIAPVILAKVSKQAQPHPEIEFLKERIIFQEKIIASLLK